MSDLDELERSCLVGRDEEQNILMVGTPLLLEHPERSPTYRFIEFATHDSVTIKLDGGTNTQTEPADKVFIELTNLQAVVYKKWLPENDVRSKKWKRLSQLNKDEIKQIQDVRGSCWVDCEWLQFYRKCDLVGSINKNGWVSLRVVGQYFRRHNGRADDLFLLGKKEWENQWYHCNANDVWVDKRYFEDTMQTSDCPKTQQCPKQCSTPLETPDHSTGCDEKEDPDLRRRKDERVKRDEELQEETNRRQKKLHEYTGKYDERVDRWKKRTGDIRQCMHYMVNFLNGLSEEHITCKNYFNDKLDDVLKKRELQNILHVQDTQKVNKAKKKMCKIFHPDKLKGSHLRVEAFGQVMLQKLNQWYEDFELLAKRNGWL